MKQKRYGGWLALALALALLTTPVGAMANKATDFAERSVARIYTEVYVTSTLLNLTNMHIFGGTGSAIAIGKADEPVEYFVTNSHVINPQDGIREWCFEQACDVILINSETYLAASKTEQEALESQCANQVFNECKFEVKSYVVFDNINDAYDLTIIKDCIYDEINRDIAVVRATYASTKRKAATFRPSNELEKTEIVHVIGFPGISDVVLSKEEQSTLRSDLDVITSKTGYVSRKVDVDGYGFVEINAEINSGNSGGALADNNGYIVGMPTFTMLNAQDANYAISSAEIMAQLDKLTLPYILATSEAEPPPSEPPSAAPTDTVPPEPTGLPTEEPEPLPTEAPQPQDASFQLLLIVLIVLSVAGIAVLVAALIARNKKHFDKPTPPQPNPSVNLRKLVCTKGALAKREFPIQGSVVIGRDPACCGIVFPTQEPGISRRHCTITFDGSKVSLKDDGSSYGTFVNGKKLAPNQSVIVHRGDVIQIGSQNNTFTLQ